MRYNSKQINEISTKKERKVLLYQQVISKNVTVKKTHGNSCEKKKKKRFYFYFIVFSILEAIF